MAHIRSTSAAAYEAVAASGFLCRTLMDVYTAVHECPGSTQAECCDWIEQKKGTRQQMRSYTPRFAVLEREGLIRANGERRCRISSRVCLTYVATPHVPAAQVKTALPPKERAFRLLVGQKKLWYGSKTAAEKAFNNAPSGAELAEFRIVEARSKP